MEPRPATPSLLRELNDRTALELLLTRGPMTRAQVGEHTGLSKVTAAQLLARLEERGLVQVTGTQSGGRGPNAAVYAVVPSSAYVAGLHVEAEVVGAGIADITGRVITEIAIDPNGSLDPVDLVHKAVSAACDSAGIDVDLLSAFVIGSPGVVDPRTGDIRLAVNMPEWHEGVLGALRSDLGRTVIIENDANLAAMAEHAIGAAQHVNDFALVWLSTGLGLAAVLGGKPHKGVAGAAGEIGYLPVPGVGLPEDVRRAPVTGSFQSLAGANMVRRLAADFGFTAGPGRTGQSPPRSWRMPRRTRPRVAGPGRTSLTSWPAGWRWGSRRSAWCWTLGWSYWAAASAWPAGPNWPAGSRPGSAGSARRPQRSSPPNWPTPPCCAARSSPR